MRIKLEISFNLDKKLIFLVMIVSVIALSIIGYLSFNYADQILIQRAGEQLLGESTVRGETLRLLFEARIEQNNILANDPMIQLLISKINESPEDELEESTEVNRRDFLIPCCPYLSCPISHQAPHDIIWNNASMH